MMKLSFLILFLVVAALLFTALMNIDRHRDFRAKFTTQEAKIVDLEQRIERLEGLLMVSGAIASQAWEAYYNPEWPDLYNNLYWNGPFPPFEVNDESNSILYNEEQEGGD
jgi:hypothetical protein